MQNPTIYPIIFFFYYLLKVGFVCVLFFFSAEKSLKEKCVRVLKCLNMDCLSHKSAGYGTVANAFPFDIICS